MLRPYFLHHRELLGELCRAGWEVVRQLMVAATQRLDLQPGMVSVVHTAGDLLGWHPHVHAIASRGGWDADGEWVPVPFVGTRARARSGLRCCCPGVDTHVAEQVVLEDPRHMVIADTYTHLAPHRGQLTVYLRLNDVAVPAIYGPSADERSFE